MLRLPKLRQIQFRPSSETGSIRKHQFQFRLNHFFVLLSVILTDLRLQQKAEAQQKRPVSQVIQSDGELVVLTSVIVRVTHCESLRDLAKYCNTGSSERTAVPEEDVNSTVTSVVKLGATNK